MNTTITLTPQELAHVLAGLRSFHREYQRRLSEEFSVELTAEALRESFPQLEDEDVLTPDAIDYLCKRINCAETPNVSIKVEGGMVTEVRASCSLAVDVFDTDCDYSREEFDDRAMFHEKLPEGVY